jgi:uncharacterized protein YcnI
MTMSPRCRNALAFTAVAAAVLLWPGTASGHVTVQPTTAVAGSETTFTFRVPTESTTARTTRIVLALPMSNPIPVVLLEPVPGWRSSIEHQALASPVRTDDGPVTSAVSRVIWTATTRANAIAPGQFREFTIAAAPVPGGNRLVFKVLQYYSNGTVVRWIDPPAAGAEAAHPAPVVSVRSNGNIADAPVSRPGDDGNGWITIAAFVVGLLGLVAGSVALVIVRRSRGGDPK